MKAKGHKTTHAESLAALARIEGQVRGIKKMVEEGKYCIDIITQIHAAQSALLRVSENILAKHIRNCVVDAMKGSSEQERGKKIDELMAVIKRLHKL